jgi:hypothetical protein
MPISCASTSAKKLDPEGSVDSMLSRASFSFRQGTDVPDRPAEASAGNAGRQWD